MAKGNDHFEVDRAVLPAHGDVLIIKPRDGWVKVGHKADGARHPHWRRCASFAVPCRKTKSGDLVPTPFLTLELLRKACIDGRYDGERRMGTVAPLRRPEEILGPVLPKAESPGRDAPQRLTWQEADVFCRLADAALPDETQAELICCSWLADALPHRCARFWTASSWSDWSYSLLGFDHHQDRWFAAPDRQLPDAFPPGDKRVLVVPDPDCGCRREPAVSHSVHAAALLVIPYDDR